MLTYGNSVNDDILVFNKFNIYHVLSKTFAYQHKVQLKLMGILLLVFGDKQ